MDSSVWACLLLPPPQQRPPEEAAKAAAALLLALERWRRDCDLALLQPSEDIVASSLQSPSSRRGKRGRLTYVHVIEVKVRG